MSRHHASRHRHSSRRGVVGLTVATGLTLGSVGLTPIVSARDEQPAPDLATVDGIIAELEKISRGTEAVSEEVTELDSQVQAKEEELRHAEGELKHSEDRVLRAQDDLKAFSGKIPYFAEERMRSEVVNPLSAALGSVSAQNAIDRVGYINKMFRDNDEVVSCAVQVRKDTEDGKANALRLQGDTRKQLNDLAKRRDDLDRRSAEFDERAEHVKSMADSPSPEQRSVWISKNNLITEGLDKLFGFPATVDVAMSKLDSPYSWGVTGPSEFDCSSLMYWTYQQIGKSIPRTSQTQLADGAPVSRDQLRPGDIIGYCPGVTHVGMYIGNGQIIHASDCDIPVQAVPIDQGDPYQGAVHF